MKTYFKSAVFVITLAGLVSGAAAKQTPWRLADALSLPGWLSLSGTHRTRYETLDGQFRAGRDGGDQILVMRTTLLGKVRYDAFSVIGELMDSRAMLDDSGTPLSTGIVNPAELLQAYVQWEGGALFAADSKTNVRVGRITIDVGSRRLVARNRFRNTINAFTGIDWQWQSASGRQLRAFFTMPVARKPTRLGDLDDNKVEFDDEDLDIKFWGVYFADTLAWGDLAELYYFGLKERDSNDRPSRNRDISTIGFRIYRAPQLSAFDYQIESAFQVGDSRSSSALNNTTDLEHFAHFQHGEVGYSFAHRWRVRVIAQYDFASGDDHPVDGNNERFDTLFGARRFDFGPTSIYGPIARANIHTPGLRMQLKPTAKISAFVAYRAYWLAANRDAWTTARVRDVSGATDDFIGQQVEARIRWNVVPDNVRLEAGIAYLFTGDFKRDAPNANGQGDATYLYSQVGLSF